MPEKNITEDRTEFVDREGEMAVLESMFEQAKMGTGSILMLYGEIGVGKTRLMMEFGKRVEEQGGAFLYGKCNSYGEEVPYAPITDALENYSRSIETEIGIGMGLMGFAEDEEAAPTGLMGLGSREERAGNVAGLMIEKENMFRDVLEQLKEVSEKKPLVLFIDDIQWAGKGTLQMLSFLGASISDSRIMICTSHRSDEIPNRDEEKSPLLETIELLSKEKMYRSMELKPLEKEYMARMVGNILHKEDIPEKLCDSLYEETGGNPLFVEEILSSLIEDRILEEGLQNWDDSIDILSFSIPSTILDVLERRIANLSTAARRALRYAAVAGNEIELDLLFELCDMTEEDILDAIEELTNQGILEEITKSDRIFLIFRRKQASAFISRRLSRSRNLIINRKLGYGIEKLYADSIDEHIYSLARHFLEGHVYDKAYTYLTKCAEDSMKRLAPEKALNYYLSALSVLSEHMDAERHKEDIMKISWSAGELLMGESRWEEAMEHFQRGLYLANILKNRDYISMFQRGVADAMRNLGEYEEAEKLYNSSLEIAIELDDHKGIAEANHGLGYIHWRKGEFRDAISHYNEAISSAMKIDDAQLMAGLFIELGNTYNQRGDLDRALDYYSRSIESLKEFGNYQEIARALNNIGDIYLRRGEWKNAIESLEKCRENAEKARNRNYIAWSLFNGAEAYAKMGELEKAEKYAREGLDICREMNDRIGEHGALKALGITLTKKGEMEKALEAFREALKIADEMNIPYEKGTSLMEMAETYKMMGDAKREKEALEEALRIFKEVGAEQDMAKVEELLKALND